MLIKKIKEICTKKSFFKLHKGENEYRLEIFLDKPLKITLVTPLNIVNIGDVKIEHSGDFVFRNENGEISVFTEGSPLYLDSINSSIHLNSRNSKCLKYLEESIEYRKNIEKEKEENIKRIKEYQNKLLQEKEEFLRRIENLEKALSKFLGD